MAQILLIEDNQYRTIRRPVTGVSDDIHNGIQVRLHRIDQEKGVTEVVAEQSCSIEVSKTEKQRKKALIALELLDRVNLGSDGVIVVAGAVYGGSQQFLQGIRVRELDFVVERQPSSLVKLKTAGNCKGNFGEKVSISSLLLDLKWTEISLAQHFSLQLIKYLVADLTEILLSSGEVARLFTAQKGGIPGVHRDTIFALSSIRNKELKELLQAVSWVRWIRPLVRQQERSERKAANIKPSSKKEILATANSKYAGLSIRANITLARQQDQRITWNQGNNSQDKPALRGVLSSVSPVLNVVELFAGAGGMGLGFLLAAKGKSRYRLTFCGEVHSIYVETLRRNHRELQKRKLLKQSDSVPEDLRAWDLRTNEALEAAKSKAKDVGGIDVLIGGPPCQGFSSANRNSGHSENPNNQHINTFFNYVEKLKPKVFLMENVQGILWTPKASQSDYLFNVVDWVMKRMETAGYLVFPKLLDAVWYGVPQHRSRFFILGIHRELGYHQEDFGEWGPFPFPTHGFETSRPYVTVKEAIGDLPPIGNGCSENEISYEEPSARELKKNLFLGMMRKGSQKGVISDHITSRHADYVIERYRLIPPGGNWEDIAEQLTNYADIKRTHSNIYRRLRWDEPSITIGHYRKSMLVHPDQHRGLSLREASRLQSFPDWFRFAGSTDGTNGGLMHKQQQLANAVCPLVTQGVAEFILDL